MAEIEKVIEQLKQLEHCITKSCDETCTYYEDDMYHCHYDISVEETVDEAIQTIRELQNDNDELFKKLFLVDCESCKAHYEDAIRELQKQIPKWHLCEEELPTDNIKNVLVCLKNGAVFQATWSIFRHTFRMVCRHGINEFYAENPVIAWYELPKF